MSAINLIICDNCEMDISAQEDENHFLHVSIMGLCGHEHDEPLDFCGPECLSKWCRKVMAPELKVMK